MNNYDKGNHHQFLFNYAKGANSLRFLNHIMRSSPLLHPAFTDLKAGWYCFDHPILCRNSTYFRHCMGPWSPESPKPHP